MSTNYHDALTPADLRGLQRSTYARSHAGLERCDLCHYAIDPETGGCATGCQWWAAYWATLTPAEQDAELAMMDDYVMQHMGDA